MRLLMTVVLGTACLAGCATHPETLGSRDDSGAGAPSMGRQAIRPLMREYNSGLELSERRIITDAGAFRAAWEQAFALRGELPARPGVDFDREVVILAALGSRRSGGFAIDIDSVQATADRYEVYVRTTSPGPTCGTTGALTEPVVMVAAPKSALPPRFHENALVTNCR